mgnify:CR=1 FL=1
MVTIGVGSTTGALFGSIAGVSAGAVTGAGAESMVASEMVLQKPSQLIARQAAVGAVAGLSAGLTTSLLHQTLGSLDGLAGLGVGLALGSAAALLLPERGQTAVDSHWTNLESLQAPKLWEKNLTGEGVGVAVLDTGLSSHAVLRDNIVAYRSFVDDKQDIHDDHFHGTAMSGIISGYGKDGNYPAVAPNANLIGLKVADDKGSLKLNKLAEAIRWSIENQERYNIQVLNMSFTGEAKDDPLETAEVLKAVEEASAKGIIVVASAGNDGPDPSKMQAPASAPSAISVASLESKTSTISDFSHRSPVGEDHATVSAPGSGWLEPITGGGYWVEGGTSHAAAALSGVIALWKQAKPDLTPAQAQEALERSALDLKQAPEAQGAGAARALDGLRWLEAHS